jgi:DNA polymerase II small subunit
MNAEVAKSIREKGVLLEKELFDLITGIEDSELAKKLLNVIVDNAGQRFITKSVLNKNIEFVHNFFKTIPGEAKTTIENTFVRLGISLEIKKEQTVVNSNSNVKSTNPVPVQNKDGRYQIYYAETRPDKKIDVNDFVGHFRSRYQQIQRMLMYRPELQNLTAINKISSDRQNFSIIGMVIEKRATKNKNLIIKVEDLTGQINVLVRADKKELYETAEEIQVDEVVGFRVSGSREIVFANDIVYPDAFIQNKAKFNEDISIAFISDIHAGSNLHLGECVHRFLDWINSDDENAKKIKYLFIVGDNVDGVGIFPGQEAVLKLKTMKEQYQLLASYLRRIPKNITMFMCPGQHDASRVAEPQPIIDKRYAAPLYEIENLVLVTNPTMVKLIEDSNQFKVLMYHGASIHSFINEVKELREIKAHKTPARAVRHMLKRRHLAPMHGISPSIVYTPNAEKDPLVISEVPDILCTGEVHRLDIENYNGVIIITGSCWQSQTPFEEKVGNIPDPGKVPVFNLKTRELKVFDFTTAEDKK